MIKFLPLSYLLFLIAFTNCNENIKTEDTTYFGGEIINPKDDFVLLYKDDVLIDSVALDDKNRFLYKFNNFTAGLYHFNHKEYQYVYIEPTDSIVFRLNTIDFDESLTFSGKGAHKNNFIINTFLANEMHDKKAYKLYKLPPEKFSTLISSELQQRLNMLEQHKERHDFSEGFNEVANAHIVYHFHALKERYPIYNRQQADSINKQQFYKFREKIDFNTGNLGSFYPYYEYLYALIDNLSAQKLKQSHPNEDQLISYSSKVDVIDSLVQNETLKNQLLKNTTLHYLTNIKCKTKAKELFAYFNKHNTNIENKKKVTKLVKAIERLNVGNYIPDFNVTTIENKTLAFKKTIHKPTVVYFWSSNNPRHLKSVHKRVVQYSSNNHFNFVGVSLDDNKKDWKKYSQKLNLKNGYLLTDPKITKENLLIQNINKVYVLDKDAKILSSDLNIFDPHFSEKLRILY